MYVFTSCAVLELAIARTLWLCRSLMKVFVVVETDIGLAVQFVVDQS